MSTIFQTIPTISAALDSRLKPGRGLHPPVGVSEGRWMSVQALRTLPLLSASGRKMTLGGETAVVKLRW